MSQKDKIKDIIQEIGIQLVETYENVVLVGYGFKEVNGIKTDEECLVIGVTKKLKKIALHSKQIIPEEILGIRTDVVEVGEIRSLEYTNRMRPCPGGLSVGHIDITAGSIGLPKVYLKSSGELCLLSNNHVLANCNEASIGDPILQPGPHDGGHISKDQLATLHDYVTINWVDPSMCGTANFIKNVLNEIADLFNRKTRFKTVVEQPTTNLVDAAIAKPLQDPDMSDRVLDIGIPQGVHTNLELGMEVQKTGRTTEHTTGVIEQLYATITVAYSSSMLGQRAIFTDQIITAQMGSPGDSGSALFDMDSYFVGLLFAGSDSATVFNTANNVLGLLEVELE